MLDTGMPVNYVSVHGDEAAAQMQRDHARRAEAVQCAHAHKQPVVCSSPACGRSHFDMKACQKCKAAWYCNAACSKAHWKAHKRECAALAQGVSARVEQHEDLSALLGALAVNE